MGLPNTFTRSLAAASATNIAASQTPGAGAITLNGSAVVNGVAVLDTQRRVLITSGASDAGITYTVNGTNGAGFPISDTFAGGATTAQSNLDFLTVTSVTHTGSVASTVTIGTNTVGSSLWQIVNTGPVPTNFSWYIEGRTGTTTFNLEYTFDDPNILPGTGGLNAAGLTFPSPITLTSTAGTASMTTPFFAWRLTTLTGTGTLVVRGLQSGLGSP
jgi:hypothetical protein